MGNYGFSKVELDRVLTFEGYGNKSARYWFLGIEEGGGTIEQLRQRATLFASVEDIHSVKKIGLGEKMLNNLTLRTMSKFIMAMQGEPKWQEKDTAKEYHATRLGRLDSDTFLTELMPLPCPNTKVWPYPMIFPSRAEYNAMVRPLRIRWLRSEIAEHQPRFVICYGKGNWRHHEEIFSDVPFTSELNGKIRLGHDGPSTIILIPFFSPTTDCVPTTLITQIASLFGVVHKEGN